MSLKPPASRFTLTPEAIALVLIFLAVAWRLACASAVDHYAGDELKCSLPTVREIQAGRIPVYVYSNAYMAPVHELFSAILFNLFGESRLALRLPGAVFASLAVGVWFLALRRCTNTRTAWWICLLLACPNSAVVSYTALSAPTYGAGLFLCAVVQWQTLNTAARRTVGNWLCLGLLGGVAAYVFRLSLLLTAGSLLFLFATASEVDALLVRIRTDASLRRRVRLAIGAATLAGAALAMVAYHYLTRRATYVPTTLETAVLAVTITTLVAAALYLLRISRPSFASLRNTAAFATTFLITLVPITYYFDHTVKPQLIAAGQELHDSATYQLKHAHEWPLQLRLFFERVLPTLVRGRVSEAIGGNIAAVAFTWRGGLAALTSVVATFLFYRHWRPLRSDLQLVFLVPLPLVLAALLPSWNLHNDWCFRYLLPFLPGFLLASAIALGPLFARQRAIPASFCIMYVAYCAIDCRLFLI